MRASIEIETSISRPGYSIDKRVVTHCEFSVVHKPFVGSYYHSVNGLRPSGIEGAGAFQSGAKDFAELILEANKAHTALVEAELHKLINGES